MPELDLEIIASGELPDALHRELAGFTVEPGDNRLVLRGTVADQAALIGLLIRLRQHDLQIQAVVPIRSSNRVEDVTGPFVELEIVGLVADLLARTISAAEVSQDLATTTVRVGLRAPDGLFTLLDRIEDLSLEIREIHIHQGDDSLPRRPSVG